MDNLKAIPDDCLSIPSRNININLDGDIISVVDLEKIFFLHKLNPAPEFIAAVTQIEVNKVDRIVNSLRFTEICNQHFAELTEGRAGEQLPALILRYSDLLRECFVSVRTTIGLRIRESLQNDKPLEAKFLNIPLIEKLMKLEFALHGMPIDLKGLVVKNKRSSEKTDKELLASINEVNQTLNEMKQKEFSPSSFVKAEIIDGEIVDTEKKEDEVDGENLE